MRKQLHIGEVAALVGVSPKTIRYYHEVGLLAEPARTEAGYRLYTAQDLLRLQRNEFFKERWPHSSYISTSSAIVNEPE